ncbi:uncharacterized protein LOC122393374 [Amphibalanus amphitrite]|uniref:uncharacterized protein LOC122393374 n=1 Tax=Amphibalanus amphitrite TaxID=1232801 RepID=UPI001C906411|nr:uncharacterized protein LOC122393374 [Amphibalanus amphitrite]
MATFSVWVGLAILVVAVCGQQDNTIVEPLDSPSPLYPGEVEILRDTPCPNGLYEDTDRPAATDTKICVEARLNCRIGVTWQSMCNNCTCKEGSGNLPSIECTQEDCFGYELPEEDLGNSNICGDVYECPEGCVFVRRTSSCIYCRCGTVEPANEETAPAEPETQ